MIHAMEEGGEEGEGTSQGVVLVNTLRRVVEEE